MLHLSELDAAYIAGLFEGEACFDIVNGRSPRIRIQMTDKDVIERVKRICGGSEITESSYNKKKNPKWKLCWGIHINKRDEVEAILSAILPYMSIRRARKINELLSCYKNVTLSEFEKRNIRLLCEQEKLLCDPACFLGSCELVAASAFLIGGLGHSGMRKRWSTETRLQKAEAAKQYAKVYAASL